MNQIKALLKNWRTSMLGVIVLVGVVLWSTDTIDTNEFIAVLGFMSGLGLFISKDSMVTGAPGK